MSTLKEKAKTLDKWETECRKLLPRNALKLKNTDPSWEPYDKFHLTELVRLVDAQKEIDEKENEINVWVGRLGKLQEKTDILQEDKNELNRQRVEQQNKLKQLRQNFKTILLAGCDAPLTLKFIEQIMQRFDEVFEGLVKQK
jgi:chromosome segregation ATPase